MTVLKKFGKIFSMPLQKDVENFEKKGKKFVNFKDLFKL